MTQANSTARTKRWSFRRLFQFSLRSLLIVTTVAAVAVWWWVSQLHEGETKLPGGMVLHEQLRSSPELQQQAFMGAEPMVPHGRFAALDKHGRTRARGTYDRGQPVGGWAVYHENGRPALSGRTSEGQRSGTWRAWDERGYRRLEIAHGTPLVSEKIVSMAMTGIAIPPTGPQLPPVAHAAREGSTRIYHANGRLAASGPYERDVREGHWTFWNEQGAKTAEGEYRAGNKHGRWTLYEPPATPRKTWFLAGRELPDAEKLAEQAAAQLTSSDPPARFEALYALGALGPVGAPHVVGVLESSDADLVCSALRVLSHLGPDAESALPHIRRLAESRDQAIQLDALLALLVLDERAADETFGKLLAMIDLDAEATHGSLLDRLAADIPCELAHYRKALASTDRETRLRALHLLAHLAQPDSRSGPPPDVPVQAILTLLAETEQHADARTASTARDVRKTWEMSSLRRINGWGGMMGGFF